ncbi:MAG: AsmA-like C-terminal region-containing protein [Gemmobacter sp.]
MEGGSEARDSQREADGHAVTPAAGCPAPQSPDPDLPKPEFPAPHGPASDGPALPPGTHALPEPHGPARATPTHPERAPDPADVELPSPAELAHSLDPEAAAPPAAALPARKTQHRDHHRHRRRRHHRARVPWGILSVLFLAVVLAGLVANLPGRSVGLPVWAVAEVEARMNAALRRALAGKPGGLATASLGAARLAFDADRRPRLEFGDFRLTQPGGATLLTLPQTTVTLAPGALTGQGLRVASLRVTGAQVRLRRLEGGQLDLALGGGLSALAFDGVAALFDAADRLFALPALDRLTHLEAEGMTLTIEDAAAGRVWEMGDGRLRLDNRADALAGEMALSLIGGGVAPARAVLTAVTDKGSPEARVSVTVDQVAARDLASLAAPLAFLGVLDAPISGRIDTGFGEGGRLERLDARLDVSAGALTAGAGAQPVAFDHAALALSFDPARNRLDLAEIAVEGPSLRLSASGHAYLPGASEGLPQVMLAQFALREVRMDPEGLFVAPAVFTGGALDLRLRLSPFTLEVGQLQLLDGERRLSAKGRAAVVEGGWRVSLDMGVDAIGHDRLLSLWPLRLVPGTRAWLADNVQEGVLSNVRGAVRLAPGAEPRLSLTYDYSSAGVRFMRTLPPVEGGFGYATLDGTRYTLVLDRGEVVPPDGGRIDVAGSVFAVPDITRKPSVAEVTLRTAGSLTATLSLLDQPPFGFLTRAGQPVDLGEGRAVVEARLSVPLVDALTPEDVDWRVAGVISDVRSDRLVPGRVIEAAELAVTGTPEALEIAGRGTLDGVAFDATYRQPLGPGDSGATLQGTVALSAGAATRLGLGLPPGLLSGAGQGQIAVDLPKGGVPVLRLTSDLRQLGLAIPEIGWSKAKGAAGRLEVTARLSNPAAIERLELEAPGLSASGTVSLRPGGGLDRARFARVRAGGWLDAGVTLVGRGGAAPAVEIAGGAVDLRRMPDRMGGGSAAQGGGTEIRMELDRVTVSDGIALTGVRGTFGTRGGLGGQFLARVNGQAVVQGSVAPSAGGTSVRITSQDAGAVLSAAGLFPNARGGDLVMTLRPRGGGYDGRADIGVVRLRGTPVLAELLNAASIVGLFEQLDGQGLLFQNAQADFRLTPRAVEVTRASAVGASIGISLAGIYDVEQNRLDMQGVISPIYLFNGIGAVLTRRGEGLFGFNYRLTGSAARPQISVNPLSILTPAMFRDIFRRPAPRIVEGGAPPAASP